MSEPVKTKEVTTVKQEPVKPKELDWDQVVLKWKDLKDYLATFAGKVKHNPYLFFKHRYKDLESRYIKAKLEGTLNEALYNEILAIKFEPPSIDKIPDQNLYTTLEVGIQKGMTTIGPTTKEGEKK